MLGILGRNPPPFFFQAELLGISRIDRTVFYAHTRSDWHPSVEVLVVVRAGVIKLLEYPPDRQGYNWLPQNCLQKNEKILSTSTSPGRNFAVKCSCGPC